MTINSYHSAAEYLGCKTDRPLDGRSSRLIRRDDSTIAVRYHNTDVVIYHADETITLNTGGWYSVTTKARMCEYTRIRLYSIKGVWYVGGDWKDQSPIFVDGMTINLDGQPLHPQFPSLGDTERKRKLDKLVSAYIKGFAHSINTNGLSDPSNGDCFGCLFQVVGAPEVTQGAMRRERPTPHGRVEPMGVDHYLSHFEESYYVPSLLWNAIKARGYTNPPLIWRLIRDRKDVDMAARILRGYFKDLKPALLAEYK